MLSDLFASFASAPKTSTMYWATSEKEKKPRYFFTFGYNPFWWRSILFSSLCITFTLWYEKKYLLKKQVIPSTWECSYKNHFTPLFVRVEWTKKHDNASFFQPDEHWKRLPSVTHFLQHTQCSALRTIINDILPRFPLFE